ncbi:MAG: hypothetical protein GY832_18870 [Chloroflexi bacterium]|nr:hypothetical protein [Chloroflexota bacterium]
MPRLATISQEGGGNVTIDATTQEKLMTIIEYLQDQVQRIDNLLFQVNDLEENEICTGRVYWRDQNTPGQTPKMCIAHSVNGLCPLHGEAKPGGRLRVYVGTDPEKQDQVLEAIECQQRKGRLESQVRQTEIWLRRVEHAIDDAWHIVTDQQRRER